MNQPLIAFYAPYPLPTATDRGSAIRPRKMWEAFEGLGYEIIDLTGTRAERKTKLATFKARLAAGERVQFAYCENSSMPALLTESDHLPRLPLVDHQIFKGFKTARIPVGYFYRDCYWRFPRYLESVGKIVGYAMRGLYRLELKALERRIDHLFLPSLPMVKYVPGDWENRYSALPPGAPITDTVATENPDKELRILYVGGIGAFYRIHELVRAVAATPRTRLIICTREAEWEANRSEYEPLMPADSRIEVVHESGSGLEKLYARADVCALVMQPDVYRDFAAPIKLFEYIGHGKPVLATTGSFAADVVKHFACGDEVAYEAGAISQLLNKYLNPTYLQHMQEQTEASRGDQTWTARALSVAETLTGTSTPEQCSC